MYWLMARGEYEDKRDWPEYNEKLVRRGELYFSFEFLDSWADDLARLNDGKVGRIGHRLRTIYKIRVRNISRENLA